MSRSINAANAPFWARARFQIPGCLLVAAAIPYLVRAVARPEAEPLTLLNQTLIASAIAIVLGAWLYRQLTTYPGVEQGSHILPAFSVSYGIVLAVVLFARIDYNRTVLLSGYLLSITWFYGTYFAIDRRRKLRIAVVPLGHVDSLLVLHQVSCALLGSPADDVRSFDAVAADFRQDLPPEWERQLSDWALEGMSVYHTKHLMESLTGRVELEHLAESSLTSFSMRSFYVSAKNLVDWFAAVLVGLLLLPFMLLVTILVRLDSPGPAIFRQRRIGYRGRPFTVYKFRTMVTASADDADERATAITQNEDSRITRTGRLLRRTRIDELPQILNILRGEMSWIGPRPEAEVLSRWYETEIAFYRYRHLVRPGLTGWAQVNQGHVADVDEVTSKLHYDFYYINHFSPWLDLLIVARTVRIVITGFGSK